MEECFLSSKATLTKPDGSSFTSREIDIISCVMNGGTVKSTAKLLGISPNTVNNHIANIRSNLNYNSMDQIIKFVESSDGFIQIRERYIDLLLFNKFEDVLKKIRALELSPKYNCIVHANVEEIYKYILMDYIKLAGVKIDILYNSTNYADDKFHIICSHEKCTINFEKLSADNIVTSENHTNNEIKLSGRCIESDCSGTQYNSYFGLLGCISKIYSSKSVDDMLDEFKDYYRNIKDMRSSSNSKCNYVETTNNTENKYAMPFFLTFTILLITFATTYWYIAHWSNKTYKTVLATNINVLIGEDIFIKRKDLVSKMDKILENQKGLKFLTLVGQGGIGKTTLARHYIYANDAKIKWEINSVTEESTMKSFLALAMELSQNQQKEREELQYIQAIEEHTTKKKRIISFVFSQLKALQKWCLLFDNIDVFKNIRAFIPFNKDLCGEGTIVITTRNTNCESMNFISNKNIFNIEYLEEREKKELFCGILYGEKNKLSTKQNDEVDKFLKNIPPMPLDISNAAYYVKNTNASFEKYLEIVRTPNEELEDLHSKFADEGTEHKKTRYKMTIAAFDKLIEENPNFKALLLFICLLDSKNIPRKYLDQYDDFFVVTNFIYNLKRFFSINLNNGVFSIHKSVQEVGLMHLANILTNAEKKSFFEKIIKIMTPYSSILWEKYKTYPCRMEKNALYELETHIKSMINDLKMLHLPISEENKHITKLLLAIGFIYGENNYLQAKHYLNKALKYNGNNGYIGDYEYAIALLILGYTCVSIDEFDNAKLWLNKGLEFCSTLKDSEILKAYGFLYLGRCYAKTNEFYTAIELLEKALNVVYDNQRSWIYNTASQICLGLSNTYADHYINNKKNMDKAIDYAEESFEKLGLKNYLYKNIKDINEYTDDSIGDCYCCLIKAYNRAGEHDKAQKYALYYYHLYEKFFRKDEHIFDKARVDIEYGYTLLRKGKLNSAIDILNNVISKKEELNDNYYLFHALVSRTEALIRLNKFEEAYSDFKYATSKKGKSTDHYTKLAFCTSLYHAFIIKYKQKDYRLAFEHFSEFCRSIKEFCKSFLSASDYSMLINENAFKIIANESQIATCLQNSLKIFLFIYGKEHAFIKEYVSKNAD